MEMLAREREEEVKWRNAGRETKRERVSGKAEGGRRGAADVLGGVGGKEERETADHCSKGIPRLERGVAPRLHPPSISLPPSLISVSH